MNSGLTDSINFLLAHESALETSIMDVADELITGDHQRLIHIARSPDVLIREDVLNTSIQARMKCETIPQRETTISPENQAEKFNFFQKTRPAMRVLTLKEIESTVQSVGRLLNEFTDGSLETYDSEKDMQEEFEPYMVSGHPVSVD